MPRAGRKASAAFAISLVLAMGLVAAFAIPAGAQEGGNETATTGGGDAAQGGAGNATGDAGTGGNGTAGDDAAAGGEDGQGGFVRVVTVGVIEEGCPGGRSPCWDIPDIPIGVGETVVFVGDWLGHENSHNIHFTEGIPDLPPATRAETDARQEVRLSVPADARRPIEFICDVHKDTMIGALHPPASFAALTAGGQVEVTGMGVHFLAYWVGVIAFAILFLVYGITFFLFKYNETSATTDHWDRSGADAGGKRVSGGMAGLLAVVIAVAAVAAIIYLARFR